MGIIIKNTGELLPPYSSENDRACVVSHKLKLFDNLVDIRYNYQKSGDWWEQVCDINRAGLCG